MDDKNTAIDACSIIDDFVGHQTDQQRVRYRHLFPNVTQAAIDGVFG